MHHLEAAADIVHVLSFGRAHHRAEDAARPQVDLALDGFPGRRCEPVNQMLWLGPCLPHQFDRHVDDAFEDKIELGVDGIRCHFCFSMA